MRLEVTREARFVKGLRTRSRKGVTFFLLETPLAPRPDLVLPLYE